VCWSLERALGGWVGSLAHEEPTSPQDHIRALTRPTVGSWGMHLLTGNVTLWWWGLGKPGRGAVCVSLPRIQSS